MKKVSKFFSGFFNRKNKNSHENNEQAIATAGEQALNEIVIRCIILGDSDVGKTSLVSRFVAGEYDNEKKPLRPGDTVITSRLMDSHNVKFYICNPGAQKYRVLTSSYFRDVNIAIICYDADRYDCRNYFNDIESQIRHVERFTNNVAFYIVRTKDDTNVHCDEPFEFQDFKNSTKLDLQYISVSSKNNVRVDELFCNIANRQINLNLPQSIHNCCVE